MINKKIMVASALVTTTIISVAAIKPGPKTNDYKNLQVLPKDISSKALQQIMVDEFEDGLGVGCNYCHVQEKGASRLDYASDAKPEKEIARSMMRMTMDINKKYFGVTHPLVGDSLMVISCNNCHQGTILPE